MSNPTKILSPSSRAIITDGSMTGTSTLSASVQVDKYRFIGLDITWTGTPTGTISVLACNDGVDANFKALTFNPVLTQPAGSAGGYTIDLDFRYSFIKFQYVNASGTGTLQASMCVK